MKELNQSSTPSLHHTRLKVKRTRTPCSRHHRECHRPCPASLAFRLHRSDSRREEFLLHHSTCPAHHQARGKGRRQDSRGLAIHRLAFLHVRLPTQALYKDFFAHRLTFLLIVPGGRGMPPFPPFSPSGSPAGNGPPIPGMPGAPPFMPPSGGFPGFPPPGGQGNQGSPPPPGGQPGSFAGPPGFNGPGGDGR